MLWKVAVSGDQWKLDVRGGRRVRLSLMDSDVVIYTLNTDARTPT